MFSSYECRSCLLESTLCKYNWLVIFLISVFFQKACNTIQNQILDGFRFFSMNTGFCRCAVDLWLLPELVIMGETNNSRWPLTHLFPFSAPQVFKYTTECSKSLSKYTGRIYKDLGYILRVCVGEHFTASSNKPCITIY